MKRHAFALSLAAAMVFAIALPLSADDAFNGAVDRLSERIGKRPMRIPFLGAILFFTPAHSAHIRLATFEDVHTRLTMAELESSVHDVLGGEWHPFVRVDSRRDHESTVIYAHPCGESMRLMVITADTSEVTVVQLDVPKKLQGSWLDNARKMAHEHRHGEDGGA